VPNRIRRGTHRVQGLINALTRPVSRDYHWPLLEMSRSTLPPWMSHWDPDACASLNGSSNPSTLFQPPGVSTHSNVSACDWRIPSSRLPRRRLRQHPPTDSTHASLWSATFSRSAAANDFTSLLNCFASDWLKSYRRIKWHSDEPPARYSSFTSRSKRSRSKACQRLIDAGEVLSRSWFLLFLERLPEGRPSGRASALSPPTLRRS
jgi:hypothetical protein